MFAGTPVLIIAFLRVILSFMLKDQISGNHTDGFKKASLSGSACSPMCNGDREMIRPA
jgi:hypothetical protein